MSTFLGSSLIVCGGSTELAGNMAPNDTCDMFDFNTQAWRDMEPLSESRHQVGYLIVIVTYFLLIQYSRLLEPVYWASFM